MLTKEIIKAALDAKWHMHNLKTYGVVSLIYGVVKLSICSKST